MLVPPVESKEIPSLYEWTLANRDKIIQEVAYPAIKDACLGAALCGMTSLFVTTSVGLITLAVLPVAVTVVNIYFRIMHLYFQDFDLELPDLWKYIHQAPSLTFAIIDLTTRQTIIHEGGHYFAIKLFYEKVQPSIEIFPLYGGVTRWSMSHLTDWGKRLGRENADVAVAAAGTVATQLLNIPALIVGHYWGGQFGSYLQTSAFLSALADATYALTALSPKPKASSDFLALKKFGIHPFVCAFTVLLIPLAIKGVLLYLDQIREENPS